MCKHGSAGHVLENVEECGRSPNQKRLYALMLHDLPTSPLLPSPPLSPPLSPPPSLPSPSIPSLQTNLLLTLEVFPTDEAGVDIVVGEGDGTKLLKVKVKN